MTLNLNLSPKVLRYYYNWKKAGSKIILINIIESDKVFQIENSKYFKRDPERVILIEDNKILDKKKCLPITKAYKLEQWVYTRIGEKRYKELHEYLQNKSFYDLLGKKLSPELLDKTNITQEYEDIEMLMKQYYSYISIKKNYFAFEFTSKHEDFIPFINSIGYKLKKEKYRYLVKVPSDSDVRKIKLDIEQKVQEYIKYHSESYYNDDRIPHNFN